MSKAIILLLLMLLPYRIAFCDWSIDYYNPIKSQDDFILPMPCGGYMVFRRVYIPAKSWLDDRRIVLGEHDDNYGLFENRRFSYISGSFTDSKNPAQRFYFIGKYEVTRLQFDAIAGNCHSPQREDRLPVNEINWFDAVEFSYKYTNWLIKNTQDSIPREDGQIGLIRLPTEDEWEFAARGGVVVSDTEFEKKTFPMQGDINKYVWFEGSRSANGKPQFIGLLTPNPIGIHDILGNVDEIVLDAFRLNKLSRMHGQAGGFIVKGGNYFTSDVAIRSSYRQEIPLFGVQGPTHAKTTGFRVVISSPIVTSSNRLASLESEWKSLPKTDVVDVKPPETSNISGDPLTKLDELKNQINNPALEAQMNAVTDSMRSNIAERNEQRDRAMKAMLRLGAFLGSKLLEDNKRLAAIRSIMHDGKGVGTDQSFVIAQGVIQDANIEYYYDVVLQVAQEYSDEVIAEQNKKLNAEFDTNRLAGLKPFIESFVKCVKLYKNKKEANNIECMKYIGISN
jgi:hypothetical protein